MIDLTMSLRAEMVNLSCNSIAISFDNIADAFSDNPSPSEAEVTLPFLLIVLLSIFNNKLGVACNMQPIRAIESQSPSLSSVNSLDASAPAINSYNNMLSADANSKQCR